MPYRDWKLRVQDILESIQQVSEYVAGMDFNNFSQDQRTIDAVVRKLTIIGEAANHIPKSVWNKCPDVPWIDMCAMRNFVVHEYFGISEKIVWDTVRNDLNEIVKPLQKLLTEEEDSSYL